MYKDGLARPYDSWYLCPYLVGRGHLIFGLPRYLQLGTANIRKHLGYFQVRYDSRVVNYERKLFTRLATAGNGQYQKTFDRFREKLVSASSIPVFLSSRPNFRNSKVNNTFWHTQNNNCILTTHSSSLFLMRNEGSFTGIVYLKPFSQEKVNKPK